jgi:tungstate transport system substrate-binding protein
MGRDVQHEGWYVSVLGDGVATLREADRRNAYTLADRAGYLAGRTGLRLRVLIDGEPALRNPYHVIRVNPQHAPKVNVAGAQAFVGYLLSPTTQQRIATFRDPVSGQPLFTPDAGQPDTP